ICGGGASGRNGGFCTGWWDELDGLIELHGKAAAIEACRASGEAITAIGEWCADHGVDAWYRKSGFLEVATSETHERVLQRGAALAAEAGVGEEYTLLSAEQVRGRCNSPRFRAGVLMRDGATVQPARLARGLRRVLLERGVQIFEQTPVLSLDERPVAARTPGGTVRAGRAVVALNAWAGAFRPFRRRFADVPIEAGWGGPIDVSPTHRAFFGTLASGAVHYGLGYTGNGVGPSYLGGRILAALALDRDDRYVRLPLVGLGPKLFPPEPFR